MDMPSVETGLQIYVIDFSGIDAESASIINFSGIDVERFMS